jgi:hypothetical protein
VSVWRRLQRALDTVPSIELDDGSRFGADGEDDAERVLAGTGGHVTRNPVLPHPRKAGAFLESDFLLYAQGCLFVVEIKSLRGRISFAPVDGAASPDRTRIVQAKPGNYGEGVFCKEYPNPLAKTRSFIHHLRDYLAHSDPRFRGLTMVPVVGFSALSDISAVHGFEEGMLHVWEIPSFVAARATGRSGAPPPGWVVEGLARVPTWDRVQTTRGEWINGVLVDEAFVFQEPDSGPCSVPYAEILEIGLARRGWLSDWDELVVVRTGGRVQQGRCAGGEVRLERFGELQHHRLRNVRRVVPSLARLRPAAAQRPVASASPGETRSATWTR